MKTILLIGMPGSGKSTIGNLLAKKLEWEFLDGDELIEKENGKKLQELLDELGEEKFMILEEKTISKISLDDKILAPGGSLVYYKNLMNQLKEKSLIVFLEVPLEELKKRITNAETRGIVGLKSKSLKELFNERVPLYKKYANLTLSWEEGEDIDSSVKKILKNLNP